jgi:RimJ/RimL family protein N-acetyltransferase
MALLPAPERPLTGSVVVLRRWHRSDVPQLVEACRDPEIPRWTAVQVPYTEEDARSWVRGDPLPVEPAGDRVSFAVADRVDTDVLLGSMSIQRLQRGYLGEIGYWTAPWGRGRGVTTQAVKVLSAWAFEHFDLRRVELIIAVDNDASNKVAERAGFTREGVLRQFRENKGIWRDHIMWSLLRDELS